ncbi:MAG: hypothetical protein R2757_18715 [Draconibacterium sp.]
MKIKKKITKKMWLKLLLFVAVIGTAALFDYFFDDDLAALDEIEANAGSQPGDQNTVYLISQTNSIAVKSNVQAASDKKLQVKSHDKLIQKFHQLRNYQVLKAEVQTQTTPLINTYHYLAFKNYYFSDPDDDLLKA